MRQVYEAYAELVIRPLVTVQLEDFYSISFTHHILLLNRFKEPEERYFYIEQSATQFWSVTIMEHQIDTNLFQKQGKLPNNFQKTIAEELKPSALKVFKDEYLLNFIAGDELDDERHIEQQVVIIRRIYSSFLPPPEVKAYLFLLPPQENEAIFWVHTPNLKMGRQLLPKWQAVHKTISTLH